MPRGGGKKMVGFGRMTVITSKKQFDEIMTRAGERPVLLDFTATWCAPCKRMAPFIADLSKRAEFNHITFCKIDVDHVSEVAKLCEVTSLPSFQVWVNGAKAEGFSGASPAKLLEMLKNFARKENVSQVSIVRKAKQALRSTIKLAGNVAKSPPAVASLVAFIVLRRRLERSGLGKYSAGEILSALKKLRLEEKEEKRERKAAHAEMDEIEERMDAELPHALLSDFGVDGGRSGWRNGYLAETFNYHISRPVLYLLTPVTRLVGAVRGKERQSEKERQRKIRQANRDATSLWKKHRQVSLAMELKEPATQAELSRAYRATSFGEAHDDRMAKLSEAYFDNREHIRNAKIDQASERFVFAKMVNMQQNEPWTVAEEAAVYREIMNPLALSAKMPDPARRIIKNPDGTVDSGPASFTPFPGPLALDGGDGDVDFDARDYPKYFLRPLPYDVFAKDYSNNRRFKRYHLFAKPDFDFEEFFDHIKDNEGPAYNRAKAPPGGFKKARAKITDLIGEGSTPAKPSGERPPRPPTYHELRTAEDSGRGLGVYTPPPPAPSKGWRLKGKDGGEGARGEWGEMSAAEQLAREVLNVTSPEEMAMIEKARQASLDRYLGESGTLRAGFNAGMKSRRCSRNRTAQGYINQVMAAVSLKYRDEPGRRDELTDESVIRIRKKLIERYNKTGDLGFAVALRYVEAGKGLGNTR